MLMAKRKPGRQSSKKKSPLAAKLGRLRENLNLTQTEAAEKIGVSVRTWIAWENDQRKPAATALRLLKITFPGQI